MNNVEFIATYIYKNPGARYMEIIAALLKWKYGSDIDMSTYRGWGSTYFSESYLNKVRYKDVLWRKVDPDNRVSGYVLTLKGLGRVVVD